jgi:protein-tyrosine phosphatase
VLFICTGNFFRSAFAEHYFNFLATQNRRLEPGDPRRKRVVWVAESRGLDLAQLSPTQRAARMSAFAVERLKQLKVPLPMAGPLPAHTPSVLTVADLEKSDRVIALHDPTHRPMLRRFMEKRGVRAPNPLLDRVTYWNIEDVVRSPVIPLTPAQQAARALDEVQKAVEQLFASL